MSELYLITPPQIELESFADTLARTLDAGDVACVQLRLKEVSDDEIKKACEVLGPIVQKRDIAFLLNDRADLAKKMGCDGVHVGQQDTPYQAARDLLGEEASIGVTCHNSRHLAMIAGEKGADYVAFGAFFETRTKDVSATADIETLKWWVDLFEIPCVAIGGITTENCTPLLEAGADFLAVSGGVWHHPGGPQEAVRTFNKIMT